MQKVERPAAKRTKRKLEPELDDESPESPESPLPDVLTPDRDTPTPVASTSATQEPTPPLAPVSEPTRQMLFDEIDALRREMRRSMSETKHAHVSTLPDSLPLLSPTTMISAGFTLDSLGQFSSEHSITSHHLFL